MKGKVDHFANRKTNQTSLNLATIPPGLFRNLTYVTMETFKLPCKAADSKKEEGEMTMT